MSLHFQWTSRWYWWTTLSSTALESSLFPTLSDTPELDLRPIWICLMEEEHFSIWEDYSSFQKDLMRHKRRDYPPRPARQICQIQPGNRWAQQMPWPACFHIQSAPAPPDWAGWHRICAHEELLLWKSPILICIEWNLHLYIAHFCARGYGRIFLSFSHSLSPYIIYVIYFLYIYICFPHINMRKIRKAVCT